MTVHSNNMAATRVLGWAEVVSAGIAMLVAFYLMASPLMPAPNDHHGGMMALFSGLLLLIVATSVMVPGVALIRSHPWRWWVHTLPVVTCAFLFVFLS
jgi:hypothetical protein